MLSDTQLNEFKRNGVIRVRGLLKQEEIDAVRERISFYSRERLKNLPEEDYTLEVDGKTIRNLWRLQKHDSYFKDLSERPALLQCVGPLVGGRALCRGVETFNKPAFVGSEVPYHQDNAYFCQVPPDILSLWIAVDKVTEENGAVEYLLGSHHKMLPHEASNVNGNSLGLSNLPKRGKFDSMVGTLNPGDALIHHGQTIHRSNANVSERSRLSLVMVYQGEHTKTDPEALMRYQKAQ